MDSKRIKKWLVTTQLNMDAINVVSDIVVANTEGNARKKINAKYDKDNNCFFHIIRKVEQLN